MPSSSSATRRQLHHLHESHNPNHSTSLHVSPHDARILHWHYGELDTPNDDRNFQIHGETLLYLFILFSLILLVSLLLLYARWFFRLRHLPSSLPSNTPQFPPSAAAAQFVIHISPPPASAGLDRASIDSIPIILHQSIGFQKVNCDSECCICLGGFEYGDKVKILPSCGHQYHCDCVDAWLRDHSNCPLCRLPIALGLPL